MAIAPVAAATSAGVFADGTAALNKIGVTSGARLVSAGETLLRKSTEASLQSGDPVIDRSTATVVVAGGVAAGFSILTALKALETELQRAIANGLTSPDPQTIPTLSTIPSNVPTAKIREVIATLENLVGSADINGANLISSTARSIVVRTTPFGGRLTITPEPLDAEGLGITGLTALSADEAASALAKIQTAIATAQTRIDILVSVQNGIGLASSVNQSLVELVNAGNSGILPPGSLVNQVA